MPDFRAVSKIQWRLFLAAWIAYAFFHQGGGWNQNARFAMARAVVEEGRFAIDSFIFYSSAEATANGHRLIRTPIHDGTFRLRDADWAVVWSSDTPVRGDAGGLEQVRINGFAATGDLAYAGGHFYPSKAPGLALIAVPSYFLIHQFERLIGLDPDDWWVLTVNGWLTTALSVGLISALGCVAFFRTALLLWGGRLSEATWATLAFAFATLFFPYATILFEHNLAAVTLLSAFYFLLRARQAQTDPEASRALALAGLSAGYAAISTSIALVPVLFLAIYLLLRVERKRRWLWFALGLAGPLLLVAVYNQVCFGGPFTSSFQFQNPQAQAGGALASVLGTPRIARLVAVLVSPFCGLFFSSPVLLMSGVGLVGLWRGGRRAEAVLCSAMLGYFVLFTLSFKGLYSAWGVGPRYLVPALPFVALPLALAFRRYFRTTLLLAAFSALTMACFTAVDVKSPVGLAAVARHPGRSTMLREPLTEYALPILLTGKAWPILNVQIDDAVRVAEETLALEGTPLAEAEARLKAYREQLVSSVEDGGTDFPLALFSGPVSANPVGVYEGSWGRVFKPGESELSWNAFNAGELILPHSAGSLLFVLIPWLLLARSALGLAGRVDSRG